jgi:hypothetical protein
VESGGQDGFGEVRVFGQEPETGMDRVRASGLRGVHDRVDVQEVKPIRAIRRRCDGPDPEPVARPPDPHDDLASIGDE